MIRILVVDDHGIVRRGIAQIISENSDMVVAGEAGSAEDALVLAREEEYDVAIIDIVLPGRSGLDIIRDIRSLRPSMKVIILSMYSEEQYAIRSIRDGASAYLTKAGSDEELVPAIRAVAAGHRYITPDVADRLANYVESETELPPHERLSGREYEVFVLLGSGMTVTEIGRRLCLSPKTISTYRSRILEKMGLATNAQLVKYAITHSLTP